jgi:hypothetical protein
MNKYFIQLSQILKKVARHIPIIGREIRAEEHPYIITRKYKKEIFTFFRNIILSRDIFSHKKKIDNLIISLTSFPERIDLFEYTLFSLINQTIRPAKIVLWVSQKEFIIKHKSIPKNLARYYEFNFEIKFVKENYRSYKKLVYALKNYKDYLIVTADDDIYYPSDWLELLYNSHTLFPTNIIAHRVHDITFKNNLIDEYKNWNGEKKEISFLNFPTTGGGVLYPPYSLHEDAVNSDIFLKLCPSADDIWFYVMALLKKTKIRRINDGYQSCLNFDYELNRRFKNTPHLWTINRSTNDIQLKNVLEYYGLFDSFYKLFNDN